MNGAIVIGVDEDDEVSGIMAVKPYLLLLSTLFALPALAANTSAVLVNMIIGDDTTVSAIINVNPSLNLEGIDNGSPFTFKCNYRCLTNRTYLRLETLVTHISLRF